MSAVGAYYASNPNWPAFGRAAQGLGGEQANFANEIITELLTGATLGRYSPWAEQVSDTTWQEVPREWCYTLFPIDQALLQAAEAASFGHPVPFVALLFTQPATLEAIDRALHGSRYVRDISLGIYSIEQPAVVPPVRFLVHTQHRDTLPGDGAGGGPKSIDAVAQELGGQVVFVGQTPLPDGAPRPGVTFQEALDLQLGVPGTQPPPGGGTVPVGPPPGAEVVPAPAAPDSGAEPASLVVGTKPRADQGRNDLLVLALVGAAAAGLLWWASRRKQPSTQAAT